VLPCRRHARDGRVPALYGRLHHDRSLIRPAASLVIEQNGEWLVGRRYLSNHSLEAVLDGEKEERQHEEARELTAA
jgi:hypothetical protein